LRRRDRDPAPTGFGQRVASLVSPGLPGTHEEGDEDADAIFPKERAMTDRHTHTQTDRQTPAIL